MATLQPGLQFTGTIGNITAYELKSTGKIVLRTKGGPSSEQVKKGKNFVRTRENNTEMGGRSRAAKWARLALGDIARLADQHLGNAMQRSMIDIQDKDQLSMRGRRNICFTAAPGVLAGFQVNKRFGVETILRSPVSFEMDVASFAATLYLPRMKAGLNLFPPSYAPYYGMVACLGLVPDVIYTSRGYMPQPSNSSFAHAYTSWYATSGECAEQALQLQLPPAVAIAAGSHTLVLSFGIRLGKPVPDGSIQQHRYAGAGKILAMMPVLDS